MNVCASFFYQTFCLNDFIYIHKFVISMEKEATADDDAEFEDEEEQGINENGDREIELLQHQS